MKKGLTFLFFVALIFMTSFDIYAMNEIGSGPIGPSIKVKTSECDEFYGDAGLFKNGYYDKVSLITEDNFRNSYSDFDKYYYVIFKYNKPMEATVFRMNDEALHIAANNSGTYTRTSNKSVSSTYEKTLKNSVSTTFSSSLNSKINIDKMFSLENKISSSIMTSKDVSVKISNSYTTSSGTSFTTSIPAYNTQTTWYLETRARFNVYKVYTYEIEYDQIVINKRTKYGKKYHAYEYGVKAYNLIEENYEYSLINGSQSSGLYKYKNSLNGAFIYDEERYDHYTYLD